MSLQNGVTAMSLQDSGIAISLQDSGKAVSLQDSDISMSPRDSGKATSLGRAMSLQDSSRAVSHPDSDRAMFLPATFDYGDFVDSDEECEVEEVTEAVERYNNGLYYPICIGDVLVGKYRIEHKLGHGGFSTVWLACDIQQDKYVALKIMISGTGEDEYRMQTEIIRTVQDTSNWQFSRIPGDLFPSQPPR
jgi:hypothetical protein